MKRARLLLLLCVLLSVGCNSSAPSDSQARKVVETSYEGLTQLGAEIVDFRKLNAESLERKGHKIYVYEFLAAAKLPAGLAWQTGGMFGERPRFAKDPGRKVETLGIVTYGFTSLPEGTTAAVKGTITFRSTEKGWVSAGVPDRSDLGYCTDLKPKDCYQKLGWDKLN